MKTAYIMTCFALICGATAKPTAYASGHVERGNGGPKECFEHCAPSLGFGAGFGAAVSANVAAGAIVSPLGTGVGAGAHHYIPQLLHELQWHAGSVAWSSSSSSHQESPARPLHCAARSTSAEAIFLERAAFLDSRAL
ncbi:uncharacterized protein L969DRAFT_97414 [Mixia osmundae IAM 14324]|uniref:Uncharacterized protein n=1 Tax=Mixia osmundae (strain CBS 9802 / IAM 14324 / JCM 22182 / KY 12970) TaxID=764103 RepID=G7DUK3_MIXOS|nr:uncharacterized protein L969DRAFT_97414 [Mixia osmundae IAM 14324]KEI36403.1 hypothetical protein L969DRAFT_97414 [Mixia osmundae IAM 14324]GAA94263.1 hypothetical protein E5Q_00912 [Mixia osmundae IAM 14324]